MAIRIALATCTRHPEIDDDDAPLAAALERRGIAVSGVVWSDPTVNWNSYGACVIRSTWDFHVRPMEFLEWVGRAREETFFVNTQSLLEWNCSKSYLRDLERDGVPIVPTTIRAAGESRSIREITQEARWDRFVLKPAISAGSYLTSAYMQWSPAAEEHANAIATHADVMVQPFVEDVMAGGERSYSIFNGQASHAVRRAPFDGSSRGELQPRIEMRATDLELAGAALATLPSTPVYARVDIVDLDENRPVIAEIELIEPTMFLSKCLPAADAFARAILEAI